MDIEPHVSHKEKKFLEKWKVRRKSKVKYMSVFGLGWMLLVGVISYFFGIRFHLDQFNLLSFLISLGVHALGGVSLGYLFFQAQEKRFRQVYPD